MRSVGPLLSSVTSLRAVPPKIKRAMVTGTETFSRTAAMKSLEPLPSMSPSGMTTGWSAPPAGVTVNVSASAGTWIERPVCAVKRSL